MAEKRMDAPAIERMLYHDCGLKGLSGGRNDVRDLLAANDPPARLALDYFVYRIAIAAGALTAAMGGIDALVFTAGVGENAPAIRARVASRLAWMGIVLDEAANQRRATTISAPSSRVTVLAIPTDEELMIARHTLARVRGRA
jgi:acetate kinase